MWFQKRQKIWFREGFRLMKYNSVNEISVGDVVSMTDNTGYITEHLVITNYIKGETDAKGFTPKSNFTILIDNYGKKTAITDYRELTVASKM